MMGFKRRAFLIGGAVLVGGGAFGIKMADRSAKGRAVELTAGKGEHSFATWSGFRNLILLRCFGMGTTL